MFNDQKVIAAIVAGIVSLIISGVSGIYSVIKNRRRFEELKKELLVKSSISTFIEKKEAFLNSYRKFEQEFNIINDNNPNDGTEAIQFTIDFYANHGRDFYLRNKSILATKQLDELLTVIKKTIDSGNLNSTDDHSGKGEFGQNILSFLSELNNQTLKIN